MSHQRPRPAWGNDSQKFNPTAGIQTRCAIHGCHQPLTHHDLIVCIDHGFAIAGAMMTVMRDQPQPPPDDADAWPTHDEDWPTSTHQAPAIEQYVYYLALSPTTVKIGTTRDLGRRISQLRSDIQYVVALERGGQDVELQRHRQFATERRGRREDFHLTDRLKQHILTLMPHRDDLMRQALGNTHSD